MIYDLKNIKAHLVQNPRYIIFLFVSVYLFYYFTVLLNTNWYATLFSFFGWLSIIAIIALLISHLIVLFIHVTDAIKGIWHYLPFIVLPVSYIVTRGIFLFLQIPHHLGVALLAMCLTTLLSIVILLRFKTNKFKTQAKMKHLRVEDGSRRIIRE